MGCDIHMQVEVQRDGRWQRVEKLPPRPCAWKHEGCRRCRGTGIDTSPYWDRNYTVFSVLANVRNDGYVTPIAQPRGLPVDAGEVADYGDHSYSWLTLDEVLAYDWRQEVTGEGWVDKEVFTAWEASGRGMPETWCQEVTGRSIRHVTHSVMRRMVSNPYPWDKAERAYTLVQWSVPVTRYCEDFLAFVDSLAHTGEPKNIRLVFGFDS